MTCPNCRGETHRYDRHLVCSAGCGWSQDAPRVEPRRPQVGDTVAVRVTRHGSWSVDKVAEVAGNAVRVAGDSVWLAPERPNGEYAWRWPATQGAAVAGPAGDVGVLPHGAATAEQELEAYRRIAYEERQRHIARERDLTAAKAALEVQLRDERAAHERTTELWRRDEEKGTAAERVLRDERDALAAQLKAAREALRRIEADFDCSDTPHHQSHHAHCQSCIARAALAASGSGETQG